MAAVLDRFTDDELLTEEELLYRQEEERRQRYQDFADGMKAKLQEAMDARAESGVEHRWVQALDDYNGNDGRSSTKDRVFDSGVPDERSRRSRVHVNYTRQRTNACAAHAFNLLFPTDDKNWGMAETPVPDLVRVSDQAGQTEVVDQKPGPNQGQPLPHPDEIDPETGKPRPLLVRDVASAQMADAKKAAAAMESEIDDQLTECDYNGKNQRMILDAAKLGTGILRGPVVMNRVKKAWVKRQGPDGQPFYEMKRREVLKPETTRVDPWDFFPAPGCGDDISTAAYVWERATMNRQMLRELGETVDKDGEPIYLVDNIRKALTEGPKRTDRAWNTARGKYGSGYVDKDHEPTMYDIWTYTGEVRVEDLRLFGIELEDEFALEASKLSAIVVMVNCRPIRVTLNPAEDGALPYDVFQWEPCDGSIWGFGVPYLLRYVQTTINAAWRQMQDNAGVSHGPQIVMNEALIRPVNGERVIHGMKLWSTTNQTVQDVRNAFAVFQIQDNQASLQNIIQFAMKFGDEDTIPMLMQGEQGSATDTVGGMAMLMGNASTILKMLARRFDHQVTKPHISRYYDWNMAYNEEDSLKGDFNVKAKGATLAVTKFLQQQEIASALQLLANPATAKFVNNERLTKAALGIMTLPGVMNTPEEIKQFEQAQAKAAEQGPQDPRIATAQIKAQVDEKIAQISAESEAKNIELKALSMKLDDEREAQLMEMNLQKLALDYANQQKITTQQAQAEIAKMVLQFRMDEKSSATQAVRDDNRAEVDRIAESANQIRETAL